MSNQIGLFFSFIFLSVLICFSVELIHYQQCCGKLMTQTNQMAQYLQRYGYQPDDFKNKGKWYPDVLFSCDVTYEQKIEKIHLTACYSYYSNIEFFSFMNEQMTYELIIIRKEA